jgi:hypothetical protein
MESIMYYEYPEVNYLMHMRPLTNVSSPAMVRSEHVISILAASYSCFGGLNGVPGGQQGDIINAGAQGEICWEAGKAELQAEGVLSRNMAKIQTQIKGDQLVQKMTQIWPSYLEACASLAKHQEEAHQLLIKVVESNESYMDLIINNKVDPDTKWPIV